MTGHRGTANTRVLVSCWCEAGYRTVPMWWVWEGIAPECGTDCWPTYAARCVVAGHRPAPPWR